MGDGQRLVRVIDPTRIAKHFDAANAEVRWNLHLFDRDLGVVQQLAKRFPALRIALDQQLAAPVAIDLGFLCHFLPVSSPFLSRAPGCSKPRPEPEPVMDSRWGPGG